MNHKFLSSPLRMGIIIAVINMTSALFHIWDKINSEPNILEALFSIIGIGILSLAVWFSGLRTSVMSSLRQIFSILAGVLGLLFIHIICRLIFGKESIAFAAINTTSVGVIFFIIAIFGESYFKRISTIKS